MKVIAGISILALCVGCSNTTNVQRRYVDMRDDCRTTAERWMQRQRSAGGGMPGGPQVFEQKDVNAQLATVFSDCMFEQGWTVATPPREKAPGQAEAMQRAGASQVPQSDGVGVGPSLLPGKNMPDFRRLKYQ